jgi:hypothetical protein
MNDNDREWLPILTSSGNRRFRVAILPDGWAVIDDETDTRVERRQWRGDAEYIARRLNAGLDYVPGGHIGPPKRYP